MVIADKSKLTLGASVSVGSRTLTVVVASALFPAASKAKALAVITPGFVGVKVATPLLSITTGVLLISNCRLAIPTLSVALTWKETASPLLVKFLLRLIITFGAVVSGATVRLKL